MVAGVAVSVVQTVTSIQNNVLGFIPRAAAIFLTFALTFPWMLRRALIVFATLAAADFFFLQRFRRLL